MEPLLFLCHRIPYPPNKGDKIRSFNLLKELSKHYDIHLGAFIDDPNDWQYVNALTPYCKTVKLIGLNKKLATIKGLKAFFTNKPITLPYYHSNHLSKWVDQTIASQQIKKCFVYSSAMAQFVDKKTYNSLYKVIDFVDVDSDKWRQYADEKKGIMRWVYHREYLKLEHYEKHICKQFDASIFVSNKEADYFKTIVTTDLANKIYAMDNGVDTGYFKPNNQNIETLEIKKPAICFTGAMDYWANVDAVQWFSDQVWPKIQQEIPQLNFYIVGGNPTEQVKALATKSNIIVTGRVKDTIPYIEQSEIAIAPMRIARGIQNKVLEAMALGKAVVMTQMAAEGISTPATQQTYIQDDADLFAQKVIELVNNQLLSQQIGNDNLQTIKSDYEWSSVLSKLQHVMSAKL